MISRSVVPVALACAMALSGCTDLAYSPSATPATDSPKQQYESWEAAPRAEGTIAPLYGFDNPGRIPGTYIVRFGANVANPRPAAESIIAQHGGRLIHVYSSLKGFWAELPNEAVEAVRRNPNVVYIEADIRYETAGVGDTVQYSPPWRLDRIDQRVLPLNQAYEYSVVGAGVRIWIIDDGVDRYASDLAGRIDETWYVTNGNKDPYAPCGTHGTSMAVAAAGLNNGVAKQATIHSARVDSDCDGGLSSAASVHAFEFIADYSPRPAVANFSASTDCWWIFCGQTVDDAAKYARSRGITVVVAAGNGGSDLIGDDACGFSPAHVQELITVAASDQFDTRHGYSNWGSCVDLFAPVQATGGTSTATAMVSGTAALHLQLFPSATPAAVTSAILGRATQGQLSNIGSGSPNLLLYSKQPVLSAAIPQPWAIGPQTACTWVAQYSGGQPPYHFEWKRDGVVVSTATTYGVSQGGSTDFGLYLSIVDGVGRTVSAAQTIEIDFNNFQRRCAQ